MNVTDPIADMLTRIRNASRGGLRYATIPASVLKIEITKLLEAEGFIKGFRLVRDSGQGKIKIAMKYTEAGEPVIRGLSRVSRPGCRVYKGFEDLGRVNGGLGVSIVSSSQGVFTDSKARKARVGGEVLAQIW